MSEQLDRALDAERLKDIAKNDEARRQQEQQLRTALAQRAPAPRVIAATLAAAAMVCACAAPADDDQQARADVHCTISQLVPIVVGDQVLMVEGKCVAWEVGPTPLQQRAFGQRHWPGSRL